MFHLFHLASVGPYEALVRGEGSAQCGVDAEHGDTVVLVGAPVCVAELVPRRRRNTAKPYMPSQCNFARKVMRLQSPQ